MIESAAAEFGIPSALLHKVGMQETVLGTSSNYNPATGRDRDANKGVGTFQLDPASGASPEVLARAARDPVFAARVAAAMLARNLKATNGNVQAALAMYNAGSPAAPVGLQYAASVLGQR